MARLILALLLIALPVTANAQATGFKQGEQTTGMTKQCYYNALGSTYTLTVSAVTICPITVTIPAKQQEQQQVQTSTPQADPAPRMVTGFKRGEETTGMTKQCYYNVLGGVVTRTIDAVAICPITIQVEAP